MVNRIENREGAREQSDRTCKPFFDEKKNHKQYTQLSYVIDKCNCSECKRSIWMSITIVWYFLRLENNNKKLREKNEINEEEEDEEKNEEKNDEQKK